MTDAASEGLTKLMLKVIRDMKMMPNDVMSNGKTVSRNAYEHVRSVLKHDLEVSSLKASRRRAAAAKNAKGNADPV